jgi:hypothetical protein
MMVTARRLIAVLLATGSVTTGAVALAGPANAAPLHGPAAAPARSSPARPVASPMEDLQAQAALDTRLATATVVDGLLDTTRRAHR